MSEIPNSIRSELEGAGIDINADRKQLSRERFEPLSEASKTALMRKGFTTCFLGEFDLGECFESSVGW